MRTHAVVALIAVGGVACSVVAQPSMAIRFANGTNAITVAPGSQVLVRVFATGMPDIGTPIPWTTPPGTGQIGQHAGFVGAYFNMKGTTTGTASWSNLGFPPGMGLPLPPDPPHGFPSGTNVHAISASVGFNPPITGNEFQLWYGTITVGSANVLLHTDFFPVGLPPQTGFEVALSGILPMNVSQFVQTLNGSALITVPAPAGLALLGLGGLVGARRKRC